MDHVLTKFLSIHTPSLPPEGNKTSCPTAAEQCVQLLRLTRQTLSAKRAAELKNLDFHIPLRLVQARIMTQKQILENLGRCG